MQTTDKNLPRVIGDCHELLKWLIPLLDKFPRNRRFTLGERLESGLLAVLEECVDAAYSKHKRPQLSAANRRLSSVCHRPWWCRMIRPEDTPWPGSSRRGTSGETRPNTTQPGTTGGPRIP